MGKCKYCLTEENGDWSPDCKTLIESKIATIGHKPVWLTASVLVDTFSWSIDEFGIGQDIKIKYCPMCGRKLQTEKKHG